MDSRAPIDTKKTPKNDARSGSQSAPRSTFLLPELIRDVLASLRAPGFWLYGAWIQTSVRYRSQALGAFWMVAGTLAFVTMLGTLYSQMLGGDNPYYFGHLAAGYVFWTFMQQLLVKSSRLFQQNGSMIQNGYVNYPDYVLRDFTGQLINLAYNLIVVVGAMVVTQIPLTTAAVALLLTVPLLMLTILGVCLFFSVLGARYPDFGELLQSLMRLAFFLTPIIWSTGTTGKAGMIGPFIYLNPFYYLVEIIRGPLIYGVVPWFEIGVVVLLALIAWSVACIVYRRAKPYIPLWV
ncbi:ABC transporter permease [Methyloceanibacter sp. wino2]|uniref:ABC transporter permease n=1 Tax=Methyloceanibacter sp. wino2 TaxID=2170729 RepID=UPI000D3E2233|nr:ABC transporter permease [Methyloceanibacter sp. wino2]